MKEIYINDDIYPNMLKKIKNPPKKLFVDGNLDNLNSNCISVVGSRECTEYGKRWCESFIKKFSKYDIVVLPYEKENGQNLKQLLEKNRNIKNIAVVIGPEGGFSDKDLALLNTDNVHSVTLGPRILRTETAGIAVLSMLLYEFEF